MTTLEFNALAARVSGMACNRLTIIGDLKEHVWCLNPTSAPQFRVHVWLEPGETPSHLWSRIANTDIARLLNVRPSAIQQENQK